MQILASIRDFPAGLLAISLPFSPVKLIILIGWVYLCLHFVQRVEFSPLVPRNRRTIANIVTLFTGPILLLVLAIVDAVKRSSESNRGVFGILAEHIRNAFGGVRSSRLARSKGHTKIMLLDPSGRNIDEVYGDSKDRQDDSSILKLTEHIIAGALKDRSSDILIDPRDDTSHTVRYRVDGVLRTAYEIKSDVCQGVINCIKAVSNMDISERRRPQDGAFTAKAGQTTASFRVASAGVLHGEKLSIRILNQSAGTYTLESVGMTEKQRTAIRNAISKPSGMVLLCGPTGSGKTTTMYAMLNEIDLFTRNVITVEDPIECVLPSASQIEVNPKADITFAKSLRSILRQDPDVICVGEIRDEETAAIALRASQTGHLVLATIHSDTNASALVRLLDLGVTSLLLSSGLSVMASQRLLRRLCDHCKDPAQLSQSQIQDFTTKGIDYGGIFQAVGCKQCHETGYHGRIGIFDIMVVDDNLKDSIAKNELSIASLRDQGSKKGKSSIFMHALETVVSGITSLEELKRVVG